MLLSFVVNFQLLAQVAYFLKKYGEGSKNAKEETAVDNNMEEGQVAKEEENVESGEKEGMVEQMIGDYGPQQKVFRKMRSNPPSST